MRAGHGDISTMWFRREETGSDVFWMLSQCLSGRRCVGSAPLCAPHGPSYKPIIAPSVIAALTVAALDWAEITCQRRRPSTLLCVQRFVDNFYWPVADFLMPARSSHGRSSVNFLARIAKCKIVFKMRLYKNSNRKFLFSASRRDFYYFWQYTKNIQTHKAISLICWYWG